MFGVPASSKALTESIKPAMVPYMATIKTTVYLDVSVYRRLQALARAEGRKTAELVREAVGEYARQRSRPLPRSLALGRSGRDDVAERADDLLHGMGHLE